MDEPKMTAQTLAILGAILNEDPARDWYGLELMQAAGLKSGTIYPALARLEQAGWLESRWEEIDPSTEKRPRRRLYTLTPRGYARSIEEVDRAIAQLRARWRQRPKATLKPRIGPA